MSDPHCMGYQMIDRCIAVADSDSVRVYRALWDDETPRNRTAAETYELLVLRETVTPRWVEMIGGWQ